MKIYIYVEGPSDVYALRSLFQNWCNQLKKHGHGIKLLSLDDKTKYFRKIGHRAAEKLVANEDDLVIGLPDLYPNKVYHQSEYKHDNENELIDLQRRLVRQALITTQNVSENRLDQYIDRFYPSTLKHDLEMLLLASVACLREYLRTGDRLSHGWIRPAENQNQITPPKRIVEDLFLKYLRRAYKDTTDAPGILKRIKDIHDLIHNQDGSINCPVFNEMLSWISIRTGVPAYQ